MVLNKTNGARSCGIHLWLRIQQIYKKVVAKSLRALCWKQTKMVRRNNKRNTYRAKAARK